MLNYLYQNDLVRIIDRVPETWEESIRISGENLIEKGLIDASYIDDIITCVKEFGPYIVLVPGVAMPHASEKCTGVLGTAIAFSKFKESISFEEGNPEKEARLFFTLAAKNPEEHMANIMALSEMLMTDGLIEDLEAIETMADYEAVMAKYCTNEEL
jgi:PTS system ascorbate-specific IIA component